jgi:N-acetyl-alpha-D-muramate 1-phosphate uridylyltransferase
MRAMILAAGKGERMRPLTESKPKALLPVAGVSLIEHQIRRLVAGGHREIVINHARFGDQIEAALGDGQRLGVRIKYSAEGDEPLETGGGILKALPLLGPEPFIVLNADVWSDYPLERLPETFDGLAYLVLVNNPAHHSMGDFALRDGYILLDHAPKFTYSGVGVYRPELFDECRPGAFPLAGVLRIAASRGLLFGEHYRGVWIDVGTPKRLADLEALIADSH